VYFHLGEYNEALSFALGAGRLFDLSAKSEFVETIICIYPFRMTSNFTAYCVDRYIASQIQAQDGPAVSLKGKGQEMLRRDDRLEVVVERMFDRCIEEKEYKQVCPFW
jgi:26S proteasome regulatory subunit N2